MACPIQDFPEDNDWATFVKEAIKQESKRTDYEGCGTDLQEEKSTNRAIYLNVNARYAICPLVDVLVHRHSTYIGLCCYLVFMLDDCRISRAGRHLWSDITVHEMHVQ